MASANECTQILFSGKTPAQLWDEVHTPASDGGAEVTTFEACQLVTLYDHYRTQLRAPSRAAIRFSSSADEAREMAALGAIEGFRRDGMQYRPGTSLTQSVAVASVGDWGIPLLAGLVVAGFAVAFAWFVNSTSDDPK